MRRAGSRSILAAAALLALLAPAAAAAPAIPESPDAATAPQFVGRPAVQRPVEAPPPPQSPRMAPQGRSELHVDAYQTDANAWAGPLGRDMQRASTYHNADCASVAFDRRGRIVTICIGLQGPSGGGAGLYVLDPRTLDTLAQMNLPGRQLSVGTNPFTDFSSGGYFYLDDRDRAIVPTTTRHILVVAETEQGGAPGFAVQRDYDLSTTLAAGDQIISALPDWSGRVWFASRRGVVGTLDLGDGAIRSVATGDQIGNSFAADETGGVYIVTHAALYRFAAGADGTPQATWRATYPNDGKSKPGQTEVGSGTTPSLMTTRPYVAITDNSDPINVRVYRRRDGALVCSAPVFAPGASATDQSLVVAGNAIIAENNFGYASPAATEEGRSTTGGLERIDLDPDGRGCRRTWRSDEIAPSVVPKASLANGLLYTYTHPAGDRSDPWYLTALDLRTGETVFKYRVGSGLGFNNNYAPVTIGPDGTAYVGVLGGLALARDATPPPQPAATPAPRLRLRLHRRRRPACRAGTVRAVVVGRDRRRVRRVAFLVGRRRVAIDRRAPFARRLQIGRGARPVRIRARITLGDGRRIVLVRRVDRCRT